MGARVQRAVVVAVGVALVATGVVWLLLLLHRDPTLTYEAERGDGEDDVVVLHCAVPTGLVDDDGDGEVREVLATGEYLSAEVEHGVVVATRGEATSTSAAADIDLEQVRSEEGELDPDVPVLSIEAAQVSVDCADARLDQRSLGWLAAAVAGVGVLLVWASRRITARAGGHDLSELPPWRFGDRGDDAPR